MNSPRFSYAGAICAAVFIVWGALSLSGCFVHRDPAVPEPAPAAVRQTPAPAADSTDSIAVTDMAGAAADITSAADIAAVSSSAVSSIGNDDGAAAVAGVSEPLTVPEPISVPKPEKEAKGGILEIKEKLFLTQINDIFYNFESYKDKTIIVEGMYSVLYSWDGSESVSVVYRRGPGCCGNDGWGGFVLKYDGSYPAENAWIRVTGVPELDVAPEGYTTLYLNVISIEEKAERGAEFVNQ